MSKSGLFAHFDFKENLQLEVLRTAVVCDYLFATQREGSPVLLIHGWEGRGSQLGAFAQSPSATGFRWIGVDLPAHGDSTGRQTNLIEIASVIRSLIEKLNPVAIVAHSFGAAGTTVALGAIPFDGKLVYIAPPDPAPYLDRDP